MSPVLNQHGLFQSAIHSQISRLKLSGFSQVECAIKTDEGVKVADVAWYSVPFRNSHRDELAYLAAPELCVEVLSPSNTRAEIEDKTRLYFQHGAQEVWICDAEGRMRFMDQSGEILRSMLFPSFPNRIDIE